MNERKSWKRHGIEKRPSKEYNTKGRPKNQGRADTDKNPLAIQLLHCHIHEVSLDKSEGYRALQVNSSNFKSQTQPNT